MDAHEIGLLVAGICILIGVVASYLLSRHHSKKAEHYRQDAEKARRNRDRLMAELRADQSRTSTWHEPRTPKPQSKVAPLRPVPAAPPAPSRSNSADDFAINPYQQNMLAAQVSSSYSPSEPDHSTSRASYSGGGGSFDGGGSSGDWSSSSSSSCSSSDSSSSSSSSSSDSGSSCGSSD